MPSTYTLNNGIELIGTGEQSGTWGDTTNTNFELIDTALDGQVAVTLASAGTSGSPNTLPISDGAASNGRNRLVIFNDSSDLGATAYVQLTPSDAEKIVYVRNDLSGSRSIILFQGTYNASNDYEVPAGTTAVVYFDGAGAGAVAANVFNNAYFDSLRLGSVSVTAILDEDNMASDSDTALATQQSIKAYVDAQVTAQDLDFAGDSGTGAVDLDSQTFTIAGTANEIETSASGQTITVGLPNAVTITSLTATSADINGGTIDGTTIGGTTPAAVTTSSLVATTADINGGTIDGTTIGGTTPAAITGTTGQFDTSLNVDGTVTADGLTVDGGVNIDTAVPILRLDSPATAWAGGEDLGGLDWYTKDTSGSGPAVMARIYSESSGANTLPIPNMIFQTSVADVSLKDRLKIAGTGDISFYEDTGTTPKFFWDASTERLGLGNAAPAFALDVNGGSDNVINILRSTDNLALQSFRDSTTGSDGFVMIGANGPNMVAYTQGVERIRIDSSGNLLVGQSTVSSNAVGIGALPYGLLFSCRSGGAALAVNRRSSDGDIALFQKEGTDVGRIGTVFNSVFLRGNGVGSLFINGNADVRPFNGNTLANYDNVMDIGGATSRWDDVYATNAIIQTSDANEKQDIEELNEAERRVAVAAKGLLRKFRWKDAVTKKGDDARIHFGIIAQDLQAAFEAEGLDAGRYAMFIRSTWWEADEVIPAVEAQDAVYETQVDEDGNEVQVLVSEAVEAQPERTVTRTYETQEEEVPEGAVEKTRMGVRYSELLAFIISAM